VVVDDAGEATTTVTLGVNGNAYATVALHGGEPTFTTPLNGPLTPDERNALLVVASALFAIGFNIEYPTLMIFWCGC
jgi:hypothetical protein